MELFGFSPGKKEPIVVPLELWKPTHLGKGFLPIATTRGDRFFISLLSAAFIHLIWLASLGLEGPLWPASLLAVTWAGVLMRWG